MKKSEVGSGKSEVLADATRVAALARQALPLMTPEQRAETLRLIDEIGRTENAAATAAAAKAFQRDMRPVTDALVSALKAGDVAALQGFRALLPHLLAEVNASPELADVAALTMGKALMQGLTAKPEETL